MYKNFSLENIWVRTFDFGLTLGFGKKYISIKISKISKIPKIPKIILCSYINYKVYHKKIFGI